MTDTIEVLLIEDNRSDFLNVSRKLLAATRAKFHVEHAEWLNTALTLLKNRHFDIILLDLTLPDSHGIDTVVNIKKESPRCPVIVLSGQEDITVATRSMDAGADSFIVKSPDLSTDELEREVLYALGRSRREQTSRELMRKSVERLVVDTTPGSIPPPSVAAFLYEPLDRIDTAITMIRLYLQRNYPGSIDSVEQMLYDRGYHAAMHEIRTALKMDEPTTSRTAKISEKALETIRNASSTDDVNPEQELLRIIGGV